MGCGDLRLMNRCAHVGIEAAIRSGLAKLTMLSGRFRLQNYLVPSLASAARSWARAPLSTLARL